MPQDRGETIGEIAGRNVRAFSLTGPGGLRARVLSWGARLAELWVPDRAGRLADIVLGHDRLEDWLACPTYFGATCGRYANRIAGGRFVLDGEVFQVDLNEGANHLHGGTAGFDRKNWSVEEVSDHHVTLSCLSEDGEMGYPGRLQARCTYRFDAEGRLWVTMEAETSRPTVINLVNHAYFNMAGHDSGPVTGQLLRVAADHYLPVAADLIPTGEIAAVAGTAFDFRALRPIGQPMPGPMGFDHNLCLSSAPETVGDAMLRFCAEAVDPASGRRLQLWTSEPGVQLYTGAYLDDRLPGKAGARVSPFGGFTLETQRFPDSPNRPAFPSARLDPGQTYRHLMAISFAPAAH